MRTGAASGPTFLDEIRALQRTPGSTCSVRTFIATLTPQERDAIEAARAEGIRGATIGTWLRGKGFGGTTETVGRHLSGRCKCQPTP